MRKTFNKKVDKSEDFYSPFGNQDVKASGKAFGKKMFSDRLGFTNFIKIFNLVSAFIGLIFILVSHLLINSLTFYIIEIVLCLINLFIDGIYVLYIKKAGMVDENIETSIYQYHRSIDVIAVCLFAIFASFIIVFSMRAYSLQGLYASSKDEVANANYLFLIVNLVVELIITLTLGLVFYFKKKVRRNFIYVSLFIFLLSILSLNYILSASLISYFINDECFYMNIICYVPFIVFALLTGGIYSIYGRFAGNLNKRVL